VSLVCIECDASIVSTECDINSVVVCVECDASIVQIVQIVQMFSLLTSAKNIGELLVPRSYRFNPGEICRTNPRTESRVDQGVTVSEAGEEKNLTRLPVIATCNLGGLTRSLVIAH
jgi:hypothetical protein